MSTAIRTFHQLLKKLVVAPKWSLKLQNRTFAIGTHEKFTLPRRIENSKDNIWNKNVALELKYKPLNLGHSFPNLSPPKYITAALIEATKNEDPLAHQYARGFGHGRLVQAIAKLFSGLIKRTIDAKDELLITIGADEALFSAIMGHIEEGDEVIIIEPFYDSYTHVVKMAGGTVRYIPLKSQKPVAVSLTSTDYCLDDRELESLFNEKTKMIILNTPHNPIGKVFKRNELEKIAALCRKWNVLCVSDEVYEWMIYDGREHIRICTLPGMWERTITIGSAGKTFSVTGWKTGWAYGPANLLENMRMIHQSCVYTCPTPIQEALAICFEREMERLNTDDSYFHSLRRELQMKRDFMCKFLAEAGMRPIMPEGGCFVLADWSLLAGSIDLSTEKEEYADCRFTKWMIKNIRLQAIPLSVFYSDPNKPMGENYVRYYFHKNHETLVKAAELLRNLSLVSNGNR